MKKQKVLIIDDEIDFGSMMRVFFLNRNCEVFIAHTIADGMRMLEEELPDFVFLDNHLPDGLGWGKTEFILVNYPETHLNLISALKVPKTSASAFRILYKPDILEVLTEMFDGKAQITTNGVH